MTIYTHFVYWIHLPEHTDMHTEGYIGVSNNPKRRLSEHLNDSKLRKDKNPLFSAMLKKYRHEIMQTIIFQGTEESCYELEESLRSIKNLGWNANNGGNKPPSKLGWNPSKTTREKRSAALKGRIFSPCWREKISLSKKGEKNSMFGKKMSCTHDRKLSIIRSKHEYRLDSLAEVFRLLAKGCTIRNIAKLTGYGTSTIVSIKKDSSIYFEAFPILVKLISC